jgi:hypothetical protein
MDVMIHRALQQQSGNLPDPEQLKSLGVYLDLQIEDHGCDHTLTHTKEWSDLSIPKSKKVTFIKAIQNYGGFCDCEVSFNVVK